MERRTCKLCFKSFSNGRALGGHMRSHMATLQPPPPPLQTKLIPHQLGHSIESGSSSSSSSEEEEKEAQLSYGLRENPKKSFRLVDPEFSFAVDAGSVVQDRESETESSKNPSRRRSKRNRSKSAASVLLQPHHQQEPKQKKPNNNKADSSIVEPEPVSSVSDTTPEEDVAWCLMMLSRGVWVRKKEHEEEEEEEEEEDDDDDDDDDEEDEEAEVERSIDESVDDEAEEMKSYVNRARGKYQCGTCKKVFRSYQALGGHRASHKKIRGCNAIPESFSVPARVAREAEKERLGNAEDRRVHECPVCFRVFGSGQALGGHKRSHLSGSATNAISINHNTSSSTKFADNLIDLNLPAPIEDDEASQIELSAVSDAEFVDRIK